MRLASRHHEILEAFWVGYQGHDRDFYRGLIQAARRDASLEERESCRRFERRRARRANRPVRAAPRRVDVEVILSKLAAA